VSAQVRTPGGATIGAPEWTTLRTLAARQFGYPVAVSLFLDLHPADTLTRPAAATRVNALLDRAVEQLNDHDELVHDDAKIARAAVERGAGQLRAVGRDEQPVHGLAAYAAADGFALTLRLSEAVPDRAAVATTFRIRPVVSVRARSTDALLVHVGRELGRIFVRQDGIARMLDDLTTAVPRQPAPMPRSRRCSVTTLRIGVRSGRPRSNARCADGRQRCRGSALSTAWS
jgi:hypothetical protein